MNNLNAYLKEITEDGTVQNIAVKIGVGKEVLYESLRGNINTGTLFDMASVTKIMATTSLMLISFDKGLVSMEDSISRFFDLPEQHKHLTVKDLLTHTMGIGHKSLLDSGCDFSNISDYILNIVVDNGIFS